MAGERRQFDQAFCEYVVRTYLAGQGWTLADPPELAAAIWEDLQGEVPAGREAIQTAVWERYAALIHDLCRRPEVDEYDTAWSELRAWLARRAPMVNDDPRDQEEIVQDALVDLQNRLEASPLHAGGALWAYALATLKRKAIDLHRKRTADKRGKGEVRSLEGLAEGYQEEDAREAWEERLWRAEGRPEERTTERAVVKGEVRSQLKAFFGKHITSEWQLQVAEAHFLDGLRPAEIAGLTGKTPHEIRMMKARAVRKLRNLPATEQERLLEILAGEGDKR